MTFDSYTTLVTSMRQCRSCIFTNPHIVPLAPKEVEVPVPIMFVGENPSWAEEQDEPFSPGTISGDALENHYLKPLELQRCQVWITDLIKCRYPSKSKWPGYQKDIYRAKAKHDVEIQEVAEMCSTLWLVEEIKWTRPKVVVTLSDRQVYQRLRRAFALDVPASFEYAVGKPHSVEIEGFNTILFPMIHPDVSRPKGDGNNRKINVRMKWASLHRDKHIPMLKQLLSL